MLVQVPLSEPLNFWIGQTRSARFKPIRSFIQNIAIDWAYSFQPRHSRSI